MSFDLANNRRIVLEYFDLVFNQHDPKSAAVLYLHEDYVHHGSGAGTSRGDFIVHFLQFFRLSPAFRAQVLHCVTQDDMVVLRVVARDSEVSSLRTVAEFYRLKEEKIIEHWHVVEN